MIKRVYITHCNEKYLPIAFNLVKSIREFSKLPIIVYCLNVKKSETYIFQKYDNVYIEYLNIDIKNINNYIVSDNGNFYVDRGDLNSYEILSSKVIAMKHSLESGWDEVCYLDSDCLATPLVDEIFQWSNKITTYPLGTKGIHNYMLVIDNGIARGNPFENTWPAADNTKSLEWPLMSFMGLGPNDRGEYSTTGIMLMNKNCLDFINTWNDLNMVLPKVTNTTFIAPFHEETVYNVLKWKIGNDYLPLNYINISNGIETVKDFYINDHELNKLVEYDESQGHKNFYKIPNDKRDVKVLHGEKLTSECDKIILYVKELEKNGYFKN